MTEIIKTLENIEKDYSSNSDSNYTLDSVLKLDKKIEELKDKLKDYINKEIVTNKISALVEIIYTKCLKVERSYYKLKVIKKYQSYLNRISDYFYLLKDYVNKEM